jgi:hypothetical protein
VYADIALETVALDTPNNVAVFITDVPAKRAPTICPPLKSDKSAIYRFLHTDCHSAITDALTRTLQSVNKRKNFQCCQLKFFQCSQHKFYSSILSVSIIFASPVRTESRYVIFLLIIRVRHVTDIAPTRCASAFSLASKYARYASDNLRL